MLSKDAKLINEALVGVVKVSKVVRLVFLGVLALYCLVVAAVLVGSIPGFFTATDDIVLVVYYAIRFLATFVAISVPAVVFYTFARLFDDVSKGNSPFSVAQANRLRLIGILLILGIAFEVILPMMPIPSLEWGELSVGLFTSPSMDSGLEVNLTSALWAIVCFSLSYVFRYGTLLQKLSDETV